MGRLWQQPELKRESLRLDGLGGIDFRNEEGGNQQQKQDSRKGGDIAGGDGAQRLLILADARQGAPAKFLGDLLLLYPM